MVALLMHTVALIAVVDGIVDQGNDLTCNTRKGNLGHLGCISGELVTWLQVGKYNNNNNRINKP